MKKKKPQPKNLPGGVKKLKTGLQSLFDRLETTHSSLLTQAAAINVEQQLCKSAAENATAEHAKQGKQAARAGINASSDSILRGLIDAEEMQRRQDREQRFNQAAGQQTAKDRKLVEARAEGGGRARGSNQSLEKEYLRLTSLPSVSDVRPPQVLRQALEMVKQKWVQEVDYKYVCEQLKSIRQDLTVQHVRSALTLQVYETHARIAVEVGDWAEYKQCHSVLQGLYGDGLKGQKGEFAAYGLLHAAAAGSKVLCHEMKEVLADPALLEDRCVSHALAACRAFLAGQYVQFLKLYRDAPRMQPYLMDLLLAKLRHTAYGTIVSAYLPSLPTASLQAWLGMVPGTSFRKFLREKGAAVVDGGLSVDIKQSRAKLLRNTGGA